MKYLKTGFIFLLIFLTGVVAAYFFAFDYERFVRYIFVASTNGNVRFYGKYFMIFPNQAILVLFGVYLCLVFWLLHKQSLRVIAGSILLMAFLFASSTYASAAWSASMVLITCTACNDGKMALSFNDINYTFHFVLGLIISLLPVVYILKRQGK